MYGGLHQKSCTYASDSPSPSVGKRPLNDRWGVIRGPSVLVQDFGEVNLPSQVFVKAFPFDLVFEGDPKAFWKRRRRLLPILRYCQPSLAPGGDSSGPATGLRWPDSAFSVEDVMYPHGLLVLGRSIRYDEPTKALILNGPCFLSSSFLQRRVLVMFLLLRTKSPSLHLTSSLCWFICPTMALCDLSMLPRMYPKTFYMLPAMFSALAASRRFRVLS